MSVAPITPKEAQKQHLIKAIPDEIYGAVNEILAERYCDTDIIIFQDEVISRATEKMQLNGTNVPSEDFFTCHWLDFEPAYEEAGWIVSFEKHAYDETLTLKAYWVFHKK